MPVELATAYVSLVPSARGIGRNLSRELTRPATAAARTAGESASRSFGQRFRSGLASVGKVAFKALTAGAAVATAAVGVFAFKALKSASDLNETLSKTQQVFGGATDRVTGFADKMGTAFGLPKQEMLDAASNIGLVAKASGLGEGAAAKMSTKMAKLAADASSFFNVPLPEALEKIRSGLVGEAEPLRAFGVLLSAAAVQEKAVELGIAGAGEELTEQQKVMARAAIITEQMSDASGDLERTQGSLANRVRALRGRFQNFAAHIGTQLLPVAEKIVGWADKRMPDALGHTEVFINKARIRFGEFMDRMRRTGVIDRVRDALRGIGRFLGGVADQFRTGSGSVGQWKDSLVLLGGPMGLIVRELLPALRPLLQAIIEPVAKLANDVGPPLLRLFAQLVETLIPPLVAILKGLTTVLKAQPGLVLAVVAAWATFKIVGLVSSLLSSLILTIQGVVIGLNAMRLALLANPFVALATAVIAITILVVKNWDKIKRFVIGAAKTVFNWLKRNWPLLVAIIGGPIGIIVGLVIKHWDKIRNAIVGAARAVINWFKRNWQTILLGAILLPFGLLPAATVLLLVKFRRQVVGFFANAGRWLLDKGKAVIRGLFDGIRTVWRISVLSWLRSLDDRIRSILANAGKWLIGVGKNVLRGLWDGIKAQARSAGNVFKLVKDKVVSGFKKIFGIGSPARAMVPLGRNIMAGLLQGMVTERSALKKFVTNTLGGLQGLLGSFLAPTAGRGVQRWANIAAAALQLAGQSLKWLPDLLTQMAHESGGNVRAWNKWDRNYELYGGSKGLMQVIPPTFASHAGALRSRGIWDPLANIFAAIKYTLARYGTLGAWRARGFRGYEHGGVVARTGPAFVHRGESVLTPEQMRVLAPVGAGTGVMVVIDGSNLDRALLEWLRRAVRVQGGGNVQRALGRS